MSWPVCLQRLRLAYQAPEHPVQLPLVSVEAGLSQGSELPGCKEIPDISRAVPPSTRVQPGSCALPGVLILAVQQCGQLAEAI